MSEAAARRARTWELLHRRAQIRLEEGAASMARARQQRDELRSALERLSRLEQEYVERLRHVETTPHRLAVNLGHRLYLDQLHQLRGRIDATLQQAESAYQATRQAYFELLRACERAERSRDIVRDRIHVLAHKSERTELEATAITSFAARRRVG